MGYDRKIPPTSHGLVIVLTLSYMTDSSHSHSDNNPNLEGLLAPYFFKYQDQHCYLGLTFSQGRREMVQINVPAKDLPTLLQAQPSTGNNPGSGKNRPEVKGHVDEIKQYLRDRIKKDKPWILGTLTANVDPRNIQLIKLAEKMSLVVIPSGVKLDITDGQHRKRAISELITSSEGNLLANNNFPITLVLEPDFKQCQTDFRDMADTKPLSKTLLKSFGEFEGQVGISKLLIEKVSIFFGKTENIYDSPATKKKLIYTLKYLTKLVSCAFTGNPNDEMKDYDVELAADALASALNQVFPQCLQTQYFHETNHDDLTVKEVEDFKESCLLGRSVGLEILGRLLYCAYDKHNISFDEEKVQQLSQLDWSREGHLWQNNVVLQNPNPTNKAKSYRIGASVSAVKIAVAQAKSHLGWI